MSANPLKALFMLLLPRALSSAFITGLLLVVSSLASAAPVRKAAKVFIAAPWRGEGLVGKTGVATLTIAPVTVSNRSPVLTTQPVKLYLRRSGTNALTLLRYNFADDFSRALPLWKLSAGRYELIKVVAESSRGGLWLWRVPRGKKAPVFAIGPRMLAMLGSWQITPLAKGQLKLRLIGRGGVKVNARTKAKVLRLGGIMNGLTGKVLTKKRTGKAGGTKGRRGRRKVLGVFSRTKNIGVYYGVALSSYKRHTSTMTKILRRNDLKFRNCYLKTLRFNQDVSGKLIYRFRISQRDRLIEPAIAPGSSIKDKRLLRCLYYEISSLKVPVKLPLKGSIAFKFMTSTGR